MSYALSSIFVFMVFWRPQEWLVPQLFGIPLLQGLVYAIVLSLMLEYETGRLRFPRECPQVYLIAGLFFAVIMSHAAHFYLAGLLNALPAAFRICFFSLILFLVLDRPSRLRGIVWVFVLMACFMAVHALLQQQRGYGFGGQMPILQRRPGLDEPVLRSLFYGLFEDPNDMAQLLCTAIPLSFCLTRRGGFFGLVLGGAVSWLLLAGVMAAASRGAYVALAVIGVVMFLLLLPARWFPYLMLGLLPAGLVAIPLGVGMLDASAHDRFVFWGQANWVFRDNMLFGVGLGMFADYIDGARAAHNAFVLCYTELGIFGYWFWFCLLLTGFMGAWRTCAALTGTEEDDEARWLRRFAGLAMAAMLGFIASAYFLSRAFVFPLFFLFAMLGAVPVVAREYVDEDTVLVNAQWDVGVLGTIGSLSSIVYIYLSILVMNRIYYGL